MNIQNVVLLSLTLLPASTFAGHSGSGWIHRPADEQKIVQRTPRAATAMAVKAHTDDVAFLTLLALLRGHIDIGVALYSAGNLKAAATHMQYPEDELYEPLAAALRSRGMKGCGGPLAVLAEVVKKGGSQSEMKEAYAAVVDALDELEAAAVKKPAQLLNEVIPELVKAAATQYDAAVDQGEVVDEHAFQDALGFVWVAQDLSLELPQSGAKSEAVQEIQRQLELLTMAWPGGGAPGRLVGRRAEVPPADFYGAAARIELTALALKRPAIH